MPEAVPELNPKTEPEFVSVATTRRLNATGGIRSDQLKRVMDLVEDEPCRSGDGLARRRPQHGISVASGESCGARESSSRRALPRLRGDRRVATQAGSRRFKGHRSHALADETLSFGVWTRSVLPAIQARRISPLLAILSSVARETEGLIHGVVHAPGV